VPHKSTVRPDHGLVGASRGFGRGIATAFAQAGAPVGAVARTAASRPRSTYEPTDWRDVCVRGRVGERADRDTRSVRPTIARRDRSQSARAIAGT
jgi:NAD(P)-dependent dehydrogenase (short-subunit alcohol dehydrogenase family)